MLRFTESLSLSQTAVTESVDMTLLADLSSSNEAVHDSNGEGDSFI